MEDLLTADLHLGHLKISEYCPGRAVLGYSTEQMNESLIDRWNSVVGHDDHVDIIGDSVMGKIAETLPLLGRLHGAIDLWSGNHDRGWMGHPEKKRKGWAEKYEAANPRLTYHAEHFGTIHGVQFSHFPFSGDSQDSDRYVEHRPVDRGQWLIHGHVHDAWKQNGRQINVGVDVWDYKPVPFDVIREMMQ